MLAIMVLSSLVALFIVYVFMPALWASLIAVDDSLDRYESGIALVASRTSNSISQLCLFRPQPSTGNPFRESGPPANMAKLILLRHKVCTTPLSQ